MVNILLNRSWVELIQSQKLTGNRIGADVNKYLIAMFNGLKDGAAPAFDHSKSHYDLVRSDYNNDTNARFTDFHIGYVGFMASANGRFFDGGYSGKSKTKAGAVRDYIDESVEVWKNTHPS